MGLLLFLLPFVRVNSRIYCWFSESIFIEHFHCNRPVKRGIAHAYFSDCPGI